MNTIIYKILLLGKDGSKREVKLNEGVNIISGSSRSGKSALLKIFDYCFCSKRNTIPSGEIEDYTNIYCLILNHNNNFIILGRKSFSNSGNNKMYLFFEKHEDIVKDIDETFFQNKEEQTLDSVKKQLNAIFELVENSENDPNKSHTPSIRNMMTFFLQYQNLISSEHALFSRFDDYYNKKDTIDQFPIFAGWVDNDYFIFKREKEKINDELNKLYRLLEKEIKLVETQEKEAKEHCKNYFSIIGKNFDDSFTFDEIIKISKHLPDYNTNAIISEESRIRYLNLMDEREELKSKLNFISKRITSIEFNSKYSTDYHVNLEILKYKSNSKLIKTNFVCPLCNNDVDIANNELKKLFEAKDDLENELKSLNFHTKDYSQELFKLKEEREGVKKEISNLNSKIKYIEDQFNDIGDYKTTHDKAIYAKAQLELKLNNVLNKDIIKGIENEITDKKEYLKKIEEDLLGLDFSKKMYTAKVWMNEKISKICSELDFEERYTNPCKINFDFETFSLYIYDNINKEEISFSQLGSASNYLTCHLGLFISLLGMFWIAKSSKTPNILFLDQPSQVYFPSENDHNDLETQRVVNIYKTIIKNVDEIYKEFKDKNKKMKPQIIILDHARDLKLDEYEYRDYLRKSWWPEEDGKLI